MDKYEPVIGLEIHVELATKSKMFCECPADWFGKTPNTQTCPVCLGLPGALPVPNKQAIDWTILLGQALNCSINKRSKFDRKHYSYPDLPKGYQISQYDKPLAISGSQRLGVKNQKSKIKSKDIRITRVHLEEDTGRLAHVGDDTLVDFNRSGVPLVEIVTEPDFVSSDQVKKFLEELQTLVRYLGISDAEMDKGSMRLEPNISIRKAGSQELPDYKVEVKNINSFRFAKRAIDYEVGRQSQILDKEVIPAQETRGFDEIHMKTVSQRIKEYAHDYRYFPEPDIPPLSFTAKRLDKIKSSMPELPLQRRKRYIESMGLAKSAAEILVADKAMAEYFEKVLDKTKGISEQNIANLIVNKKLPISLSIDEFAKKARRLFESKIIDQKILAPTVGKILRENSQAVKDYKSGKESAIMFLVGQVMRELKGEA
ncbi:MAG: Asp-tRNA(Asn)/Glu-tRNA(Gln) amidotransferase subunit GatB, partial [Candidatus Paceibacterota bacterium]